MLPEAGDDLAGRVGEQDCLVPVCLAEGAREVVGLVDRVGVGEEEVLAAGGLCSGPAGVALACESSAVAQVQRRRVEYG